MSPTAEEPISDFPTSATSCSEQITRPETRHRNRKRTLNAELSEFDISAPLLEEDSSYIVFDEAAEIPGKGKELEYNKYGEEESFLEIHPLMVCFSYSFI